MIPRVGLAATALAVGDPAFPAIAEPLAVEQLDAQLGRREEHRRAGLEVRLAGADDHTTPAERSSVPSGGPERLGTASLDPGHGADRRDPAVPPHAVNRGS